MRKGDLVRLSTSCFTTKQGGTRRFPLSNYANDTAGTVEATRIATEEDVRTWRDSDASKGMTDGGDTKLPPTAYIVPLYRDRVYTLLRARCRPEWSYRSQPGMALVLCTETGKEAYVKRELLVVVD
jgi:hypothetical protein